MIRHVVMVKYKPGVSQEKLLEFSKQTAKTLGQIAGVKNLIIGQALKVEDKQVYNAALFIDFDDEAKLKSYLEHPAHKGVAANLSNLCSEFLVLDCLY